MNTLRILIVDDDVMICSLLAETLVANGHVICGIETTETGAVRAAEREAPDFIIIDVDLAAGSGLRAIEQILRHRPVAHVLISGNRMPPAAHALLKPFRPAALLYAMDRALAAARHKPSLTPQVITQANN